MLWTLLFYSFWKILFIYFYREGKGRRKRGRETSMCGCLSHAPYWGPGLQPRHVPWLGIELETLWFTGRHPIHWATPARAIILLTVFLMLYFLYPCDYSVTTNLYFLIPSPFSASPPTSRPSGNHQSVLCIYESKYSVYYVSSTSKKVVKMEYILHL